MTVAISDAFARSLLAAYDTSYAGGKVYLSTGAAAGTGAARAGTLLVTVDLPADPFAAPSGRGIAKQGTWSGVAVATGDAGHFRLVTAADTDVADQSEKREEGTVGADGSGADMELDQATVGIVLGQTVTVTTFARLF